jgi:hypothetical protein
MAYERIVEQAIADNWSAPEVRAAADEPAMAQKFHLMSQWAIVAASGDHDALVEFTETYPVYMHNLSQQLMAKGHGMHIIGGLMATAYNYPGLLIPKQPGAPEQESIAMATAA